MWIYPNRYPGTTKGWISPELPYPDSEIQELERRLKELRRRKRIRELKREIDKLEREVDGLVA